MRQTMIMCLVRTGLAALMLATLGALALLANMAGMTYEDVKTILVLVNGYLPETLLIAGVAGGVLVFYRMSIDEENDFKFSEFFRAGSQYDIYRFGYFWLLIIAGWTVFVTAWRDKPVEALIGIVLGVFVAKAGIDSIAGAIGKPRDKGEKE